MLNPSEGSWGGDRAILTGVAAFDSFVKTNHSGSSYLV